MDNEQAQEQREDAQVEQTVKSTTATAVRAMTMGGVGGFSMAQMASFEDDDTQTKSLGSIEGDAGVDDMQYTNDGDYMESFMADYEADAVQPDNQVDGFKALGVIEDMDAEQVDSGVDADIESGMEAEFSYEDEMASPAVETAYEQHLPERESCVEEAEQMMRQAQLSEQMSSGFSIGKW